MHLICNHVHPMLHHPDTNDQLRTFPASVIKSRCHAGSRVLHGLAGASAHP